MTATLAKTTARRVSKPKVITTIRLDPDLKKEAQRITQGMGIDLSTFLHLKVTELVKKRNFTLDIPEDEDTWLTPEKQKELQELVRRVDSGEEPLYGPYTADEFIAHMKTW